MTLEQNIADLTTATTELTQQVLQTKSDADAAKVSAQGSAAVAAAAEQSASAHNTAASAAQTAAEAARDAAQTSADNAAAVVTGGTATLTAEAGKIPIADAEGKIDSVWIDKGYFGIDYTPSVQPTLSSDFVHNKHKRYEQYGLEPKTILQQWDVARNSEATYFDANGVLQTAGINEPRIDYDPATGECRGLLVEGQSTNLLNWSEDFSYAGWYKDECTTTDNVVGSPDGNPTASKLVENASLGLHLLQRATPLAADGSTTAVFSVWVKKAERSAVRVRLGRGDINHSFDLNLIDGSVYRVGGKIVEYAVIKYPNDWFRVWVHTDMTEYPGVQYANIAILNDSLEGRYLGDGTSGIYIWGAQLEEGTKPSSYIPTQASAVTRVADIITPTV